MSSISDEQKQDTKTADRLRVSCADGKYTVVFDAGARLRALRYGEEWRDCVGDGLILGLAQDLQEARDELAKLKAEPEKGLRDPCGDPNCCDPANFGLPAVVARLEQIETLPKPFDLYYAVKNEGEGTSWRYSVAGFGVIELRRTIDEFDDMAYRFSCLLDHATGGLLSKTNYDKQTMYTHVDNHVNKMVAETRDDVIDECLDVQPSTAADPNENAYEHGRFNGVMDFSSAIRALKSDADSCACGDGDASGHDTVCPEVTRA